MFLSDLKYLQYLKKWEENRWEGGVVLIRVPPPCWPAAPTEQGSSLYFTIMNAHYEQPQGASSNRFVYQTIEGNRNRAPGRWRYGPGLRGTLVQLWWSSACRSGGSRGGQRSAAGQLSPSAGYLQQESPPLVLHTPASLQFLHSLSYIGCWPSCPSSAERRPYQYFFSMDWVSTPPTQNLSSRKILRRAFYLKMCFI